MSIYKRRTFLKGAIAAGALPFIPSCLTAAPKADRISLKQGARILFQGDSITDGGRSRNNDWNHVMGHGYAYIVASRLGFEHPKMDYHFFNRGVSGDTLVGLTNRWQKDAIELKPDVLSILVGVNDTSADMDGKVGFTAEAYEEKYRSLLKLTRENLPNTRLVIGEPFLLPVGKIKANWEKWNEKVKQRQVIAKDLAEEFKAAFVPYQSAFNKALKKAPAEYWIWDGVHPMPAGHELMAREWMKVLNI